MNTTYLPSFENLFAENTTEYDRAEFQTSSNFSVNSFVVDSADFDNEEASETNSIYFNNSDDSINRTEYSTENLASDFTEELLSAEVNHRYIDVSAETFFLSILDSIQLITA